MTRPRIAISTALISAVLLAGCGSSPHSPTTHTANATTTTQAAADGAAVLRRAVVAAIDADHKTSNSALWTNRVPAKPVATAGPALRQLRESVAGRRAKGIRVRMLHERFRVIDVTLDPSYATATAEILDVQTVQPTHNNGKPLGKSLSTTERAQIELHRVPTTNRFVVWKVEDSQ
jgi:uncharacterized lipoprotein YajG